MRFKENVALIVGGASGMGKATALQMAKKGASVVAFDWQKDKLEALKAEAAGLSGTLEIYAGNVNDEGARKGAVSYMKEKYGKMDPEGIGLFYKNGVNVLRGEKQLGYAQDIANAVCFFLSEEASFCCGAEQAESKKAQIDRALREKEA